MNLEPRQPHSGVKKEKPWFCEKEKKMSLQFRLKNLVKLILCRSQRKSGEAKLTHVDLHFVSTTMTALRSPVTPLFILLQIHTVC